MDVEPGQSRATDASSTGSAGEHVPADPGAGDSGKGATDEDGVENGTGKAGSVDNGADRGTAETGTGEKGSADGEAADSDDGADGGGKGRRKRSFWRELFVII